MKVGVVNCGFKLITLYDWFLKCMCYLYCSLSYTLTMISVRKEILPLPYANHFTLSTLYILTAYFVFLSYILTHLRVIFFVYLHHILLSFLKYLIKLSGEHVTKTLGTSVNTKVSYTSHKHWRGERCYVVSTLCQY